MIRALYLEMTNSVGLLVHIEIPISEYSKSGTEIKSSQMSSNMNV